MIGLGLGLGIGSIRGGLAPVNLITNGDFSDGLTGWSDGSSVGGTLSVVDGAAVLTNATAPARISQNVTFESGAEYTLTWTQTGGGLTLYFEGSLSAGAFSPGANSVTFTALPTSNLVSFRNFTADTTATIDDVVLVAVG